MKLEIKAKKENKLLGRTEIEGKLEFEGATPSNAVLQEKLAVELKADKELIVVKKIESKFSHQEAEFLAYVYDNKGSLKKMEVMSKHLRKKAEETAKKAKEAEEKDKAGEAKKEEAKEEAKAEEVKEEKKALAEEGEGKNEEGKKEEGKKK